MAESKRRMDGRQNATPTFRRLKGIRDDLQRDIYNRRELIESPYLKDDPDRWQRANSYDAQNERDQETIDEIEFVLDYFRPPVYRWPTWAYVAFGAIAAAVLVLAALAIYRVG